MASLMKTQVMQDIATKKVPSSAPLSSLSNDPLFGGFGSPSGSNSNLASGSQVIIMKEKREQERRALADALEAKRKDLASLTHQTEASSKAVKDFQREIDDGRRETVNAFDDIVYNASSKSTLLEQLRSKVGSVSHHSGSSAGGGQGKIKGLEQTGRILETEITSLISDYRHKLKSSADLKIATLKAQSGSAGTVAPADSIQNKTAALLAARMAALGVNAPAIGTAASSPATASLTQPASTVTADIMRVEDRKRQLERQIDEVSSRVSGLISRLNSLASSAPASNHTDGKGSTNMQSIMSSLKGWEPSIDEKMKFEDGIGLRSADVRQVVESLKRKKPADPVATTGGLATRVEAALTTPATSSLSSGYPYTSPSPSTSAQSPRSNQEPLGTVNNSNNPFGRPEKILAPVSPVQASTQPFAHTSATFGSTGGPQSLSNSSFQPVVESKHVVSQPTRAPESSVQSSTAKVNDIVAQAQAAIRAGKICCFLHTIY
jgi:hypothetical protein